MAAALQFIIDTINTWWNFPLPFGISFGVFLLVATGIPILWIFFKRFLGG